MASIPRDSLCFRLNDLLAVEKHYNAKYLIDCEYNGDDMCCLFYTDKKHPEGSNFFIVHFRGVDMLISDGLSYAQKLRIGVINSKDEIIHSRCRHDFRKVGDGLFIDGGDSYTKFTGDDIESIKFYSFNFDNKGNLVVHKKRTKYNEEE